MLGYAFELLRPSSLLAMSHAYGHDEEEGTAEDDDGVVQTCCHLGDAAMSSGRCRSDSVVGRVMEIPGSISSGEV